MIGLLEMQGNIEIIFMEIVLINSVPGIQLTRLARTPYIHLKQKLLLRNRVSDNRKSFFYFISSLGRVYTIAFIISR